MKGIWKVKIDKYKKGEYICPECGHKYFMKTVNDPTEFNYCPYCGDKKIELDIFGLQNGQYIRERIVNLY